MTTRESGRLSSRTPAPGRRADPRGNQRLTAMTGVILLVLFTAECLTLLSLGNLLTLHVFLRMLPLGPVSLKIGSHAVAFHPLLHWLKILRQERGRRSPCSGSCDRSSS